VAEIQIPVDLGFTEFVSSLLSEVLSSIVAAQSEQDQRVAELITLAELTFEEFEEQLADEDVESYLASVFPPSDESRPHDAVSGSPYRPAGDDGSERPPFERVLGVTFDNRDFNADRGTLLARGSRKVRDAARSQLARSQHGTVQALVAQGIPRVLVDAGRISAKLTFEALQYREEPAGGDAPATAGMAEGALIGAHDVVMIGRLPLTNVAAVLPQVLRDVRMRVRAADDRKEGTSTRTNVYGEVELTFKTIR
jgi:hypothetical protein